MSLVDEQPEVADADEPQASRKLSYKFQRLRERVRAAIESGELNGKLPGERVLARRFRVNAKTLSKALTDLAAEGLLERNIGLGTFVRGSSTPKLVHKCLVLHDTDQANCPIIAALATIGGFEVQTHDAVSALPPSLINPHRSIIVCSKTLGDDALRDLVVRGKSVVQLDRTSASYSTHAVLVDHVGAAADLARRLVRGGHTNLILVDAERPTEILKELLSLMPATISIRAGTPGDLPDTLSQGVTGIICTSVEIIPQVLTVLAEMGQAVPQQVGVSGLGRLSDDATPQATGLYVRVGKIVQAITHLLSEASPHRPVSLWLAGEYIDAELQSANS